MVTVSGTTQDIKSLGKKQLRGSLPEGSTVTATAISDKTHLI